MPELKTNEATSVTGMSIWEDDFSIGIVVVIFNGEMLVLAFAAI